MEGEAFALNWLSVFLLTVVIFLFSLAKLTKSSTKVRPPGPPGWPLVGNMFDLGAAPHQNLHDLRAKYGPVIMLRLGYLNALVVQSADAAAELFKNHDLAISDRKVPDALTACEYNESSLTWSAHNAHWRTVRRLASSQLLVNKKISDSVPLRRKCVDNMIKWIEEDATASRAKEGSGEVQLDQFLFLMAFNVVGNLVLSRDLLGFNSEDGHEFYEAMDAFMGWVGKPNIADYLPFLKWLDPVSVKKNTTKELRRTLKIASSFVKERIQERESGRDSRAIRDFTDTLLDHKGDGKEGPDKFSEKDVNIILLEMFFGGSETTSSTVEWAMTELFRSPELMEKLKEELDRVVGRSRKVEESDIDELPYLQAVVKETLRLHPTVPLLVPRKTTQDINYMGYDIPKDTQVLVNAWAIGRDPDSWEDHLTFNPDRFIGSNIEYKGQNYELIPFGSGRRICVGFYLAHRVVTLALSSLVHSFDWKLGNNVMPDTIDMKERSGITLRKLQPLRAIPTKRNFKT